MPAIHLAAFDPVAALVGGAFIGIASVARMGLSGRVTGLTSVPAGLVRGHADEPERWLFLGGLIGSGLVLRAVFPAAFSAADLAPWREVVAGLASGAGAALVSGRCPSGHGIRGNDALSLRAIAFTTAALAWACVLACATRAASALHGVKLAEAPPRDAFLTLAAQLLVGHLAAYACLLAGARFGGLRDKRARDAASAVDGSLIGVGIGLSGVASPARCIGCFDLSTGAWDPTVALLLLGAALVTTPAIKIEALRAKVAHPALTDKPVEVPASSPPKWRHLVGGLLFFTGVGLAGVFPGPALVSVLSPHGAPIRYLASLFFGVVLADAALPALPVLQEEAKPCCGGAQQGAKSPAKAAS